MERIERTHKNEMTWNLLEWTVPRVYKSVQPAAGAEKLKGDALGKF